MTTTDRCAALFFSAIGGWAIAVASPSVASAQTREDLVASARSAARHGDYEEAVRGYAQARAVGAGGLDTELALASWQAGQDGFALDVLAGSTEEEAPLLAHAIRAELDPALVLTLAPSTRRDIGAQLTDAAIAFDASQVLMWTSALGTTAAVLSFAWPETCQGACDETKLHVAGALGLGALTTLAAGLTLAIVGHVGRASAVSPLRADARGVALVF